MKNLDMLSGLPDEVIHKVLDEADKLIEEEATAYLVANKIWHDWATSGPRGELTWPSTEARRERARKAMAEAAAA